MTEQVLQKSDLNIKGLREPLEKALKYLCKKCFLHDGHTKAKYTAKDVDDYII